LPWVGRELYEKKESELDRMLGSLEGYIKRRMKTHHAALRAFHADSPHPQEEVSYRLLHLARPSHAHNPSFVVLGLSVAADQALA
jgi:hypothetical protein